jgi:tol-pal system protein YbgF
VMRLQHIALLLLLPLPACMATKADVRLLQDELRAMRAASAQTGEMNRAQTDSVLRLVTRANDSLRALTTRSSRFQSDVNARLLEMERQIIVVQELTGQSQRRLQELRAALEDRSPDAAFDTGPSREQSPSGGAGPAAPGLPGPNRLFEMAKDQFDRGSARAAREALDTLIITYPSADIVPTAQFFVAEAYAQERNRPAADSVYNLVVRRWPRSDRAPTALYKLALSNRSAGRATAARSLLERIVRDYPQSDEAAFAREQLRSR